MAVTRVYISNTSDFGDFEIPYKQIDGTITFEVDPLHEANANITDLELAPTNEKGLVEFNSNFSLVTPENIKDGNGRLTVEIPNRGNKLTASHFHRVAVTTSDETDNPGDGFLCRHGFSFLSIGWQFDPQAERAMKLEAPEAAIDGKPIEGDLFIKLQPDRDLKYLTIIPLGQTRPSYPVHEPDSKNHRLYKNRNGERHELDRTSWRFGRVSNGEIEQSDRHIYMDTGFKKGVVYELVYRTRGAPIVGCGLLSIRDIATCLRYHDEASPLDDGFDHVMSYGVSQTGRVLRHFLYEGLNRDEQNRIAYDGMFIHIAGGQRGDFNHRFAQPSVIGVPGPGQTFPFATTRTTNSISKREDGLLDNLDEEATPKIIFSNTSFEYWRGDASLIHIQDERDLDEHPKTRIYHIAGTHHIGGILVEGKQIRELPTGLATAYPLNVVVSAPVFRALFKALDEWVVSETPPPDSVHPRVSDKSASTRDAVLMKFADQTTIKVPSIAKLVSLHRLDLESEVQPVSELEPYQAYVSDVRADLNELAGIHLPDLACPVGYHSGWNPRSPDIGAEDELAIFAGFSIFFDKDIILASYPDQATYINDATICIDKLIEERFVLPEDRDWMIEIARSRYTASIA